MTTSEQNAFFKKDDTATSHYTRSLRQQVYMPWDRQ